MRRIDYPTGTIRGLASIMVAEAPCCATFNEIELVALPGSTRRSIVTDYDRRHGVRLAAYYAHRYGMMPGAHHKQWLIDQMLRLMLGEEGYAEWEREMNADTAREQWDRGVAP